MPRIINFDILKHPINWLTVGLMVLIALIAVSLVLSWNSSPLATTGTAS